MRLQGVCVGPKKSLLESQVSINKPVCGFSSQNPAAEQTPADGQGRRGPCSCSGGSCLLEMGVAGGGAGKGRHVTPAGRGPLIPIRGWETERHLLPQALSTEGLAPRRALCKVTGLLLSAPGVTTSPPSLGEGME